jgi:uncharacterized protein (DUF2147 family)
MTAKTTSKKVLVMTPTFERISKATIVSTFVSALLMGVSFNALAQDINGVWRTELTDEGYLEVNIEACDTNLLCGTILRARDTQGNEQPYEHTGKRMIWDMVASGPTNWGDGKIWDPRNDRTVNSRLELSGDTLLVSGCVFRLCQTQTWQCQL